jgi:riboflavin synthase
LFTGIIETTGLVRQVQKEGSNLHFTIESPVSSELRIDQSVSHNGVCLTVTAVEDNTHQITAVEETLQRTHLGSWQTGTLVNIERCMALGARLDGHLVQGHVDTTAVCTAVEDLNGSWRFFFEYPSNPLHLLVDKGSVCVNGVSLTVVEPSAHAFSVAIIPYTWQHTNFKRLRPGDAVNIEFDIIGKYIGRYLQAYKGNERNPLM